MVSGGILRKVASMSDVWVLSDGTALYNVHEGSACIGQGCAFHHPSDHPLKTAPIRWAQGIVMRTCEHGVAHPDVDHLSWRQRTAQTVPALHYCCATHCCGIPEHQSLSM